MLVPESQACGGERGYRGSNCCLGKGPGPRTGGAQLGEQKTGRPPHGLMWETQASSWGALDQWGRHSPVCGEP